MRCYIFASAGIDSYEWLWNTDFTDSFIICADGGVKHAQALSLKPDVWIGDGDSLGGEDSFAREMIKLPTQKDNTDTDLAVELALSRGFRDIVIIGALGGRRDHEFSHYCILKKILDNGGEGMLLDEKNIITMKNKPFNLENIGKKYVSFFPFAGDVEGFSVKGLKYEAEGLRLNCAAAQASSNCFGDSKSATVSFDSGYLLVIFADD